MSRLIDGDTLEKVLEMIPSEDIKNVDGQAYVLVRLSQVLNVIKNAPTIEPEPQWIPCSERLPEKCGNYLVTTHDGNVDVGIKDLINENMWIACDSDGFYWLGNVVAWMPMPEPYREEVN